MGSRSRRRPRQRWQFPVLVSEGPEGTYDQGYPYGATEEEFLRSAALLLGEVVPERQEHADTAGRD